MHATVVLIVTCPRRSAPPALASSCASTASASLMCCSLWKADRIMLTCVMMPSHARVRLPRRQPQLQDQAVHLVDHQAHLDLARARQLQL